MYHINFGGFGFGPSSPDFTIIFRFLTRDSLRKKKPHTDSLAIGSMLTVHGRQSLCPVIAEDNNGFASSTVVVNWSVLFPTLWDSLNLIVGLVLASPKVVYLFDFDCCLRIWLRVFSVPSFAMGYGISPFAFCYLELWCVFWVDSRWK